MPKTEKTYPDWVQAYRKQGTTVKKKGDSYYLYKRTSKRVPGKKYPQPVDTYIGIITPEGVIETNRKRIVVSDIIVKEYGYSQVLLQLCPEEWKKAVGDGWEDLLRTIIVYKSPESYLGYKYTIRDSSEYHRSFGAQAGMLESRIKNKYNVDIKKIDALKTIYIIYADKEEAVSHINEEQREILDRIGVKLGN